MFALIPLWARALALLALVAAVWGHGAYTGYSHAHGQAVAVQAQYDTFRAETAALGKVAEAHVREVEKRQQEINDALSAEYARRLAALPKFGGLRQPTNPGGGEIRVFPETTCRADGTAADTVPVAAVSVQDFDTLANLAAQTTVQLIGLQDWVRQQQAAFGF